MIFETLELAIPLLDEYDAGDAVDVFWDNGTGTVDYSTALTRRPVPLFRPGDLRSQGYGAHPYGLGLPDGRADRFGDFGASVYGTDPYGAPVPVVRVTVEVPRGFGDRVFGVKVYGPTGNATGTPLEFGRFMASDEPPPVVSNALSGYDAGMDRVTLTWSDVVE